MGTKRHEPEEIVTVRRTRQVEVPVGQGMARMDASKAERLLGWKSRPAADSIADTGASLMGRGLF